MAHIGGRGKGEERGNSFRGLKLQPRTPWKVLDRKRSSFQLSTRLYTTIPDAPSATYIIVRRKIRRISASQRRGATFSPDQLLITTPDTRPPFAAVFQKKGKQKASSGQVSLSLILDEIVGRLILKG